MTFVGYFAVGIIIAWATWIATGYIRTDFIRTILRAIITAISVTPALLAGHGIGVYPAVLLLFKKRYFWWGAAPIITAATILLIVFFSVPKIRKGYNQYRITWRDILIRPAKFKLFLIGLIIVLLHAAFLEKLYEFWVFQILVFVAIVGLHLFLCRAAQQDTSQSTVWLPVWFVIPQATGFYPNVVVYYLSGLAGSFAGKRDYYFAYLTGLIGAGIVSLKAGWLLYSAIKYAGVPHIKIQSGIFGSAIYFTVAATVLTFCLIGFRKYYVANKHQNI
jgi:hypothetical protein